MIDWPYTGLRADLIRAVLWLQPPRLAHVRRATTGTSGVAPLSRCRSAHGIGFSEMARSSQLPM